MTVQNPKISRTKLIRLELALNSKVKKGTANGCSGCMSKAWRIMLKKQPPWEYCCNGHDYLYNIGGTKNDRLLSDINLLQCVGANGHPYWGILMFLIVRMFGWKYFKNVSVRLDQSEH